MAGLCSEFDFADMGRHLLNFWLGYPAWFDDVLSSSYRRRLLFSNVEVIVSQLSSESFSDTGRAETGRTTLGVSRPSRPTC